MLVIILNSKNMFSIIVTIHFMAVFLLLQSCCSISIDKDRYIDANMMVNIAKSRNCSCVEPITFDSCIFELKPHFDKLSESDQNRVALYFLVYGKLDGGAGIAYYELIDGRRKQINLYLKSVSDDDLMKKFQLNLDQIKTFRDEAYTYTN